MSDPLMPLSQNQIKSIFAGKITFTASTMAEKPLHQINSRRL